MALPRWRDVIAYEEHEATCRAALQTIYPRFGLHPFLQELANQVPSDGMRVWPFASRAAAEAAQKHCQRKSPQSSLRLLDQHKISCLCTDAAANAHAKAFWQHTGLGASSRQAAIALGREEAPSSDQGRRLVASFGNGSPKYTIALKSTSALFQPVWLHSTLD